MSRVTAVPALSAILLAALQALAVAVRDVDEPRGTAAREGSLVQANATALNQPPVKCGCDDVMVIFPDTQRTYTCPGMCKQGKKDCVLHWGGVPIAAFGESKELEEMALNFHGYFACEHGCRVGEDYQQSKCTRQ